MKREGQCNHHWFHSWIYRSPIHLPQRPSGPRQSRDREQDLRPVATPAAAPVAATATAATAGAPRGAPGVLVTPTREFNSGGAVKPSGSLYQGIVRLCLIYMFI